MSCPLGYSFEGSLCQAPCPDGFTASDLDSTICQSNTSCEALGLITNVDDPYACDKNPGTTGPCVPPQVLQADLCQDICPASMIDNTTTCLKRLFTRIGVVPICGGSEIWNGSSCVSVSGSSGGGEAPLWFYVILLGFLSVFLVLQASTFLFEGPTHTIGPKIGKQTVDTLLGHY